MTWKVHSINYDSVNEKAAVHIIGPSPSGQHMAIHIHVPSPGDLRESEIQLLIRAKAKEVLVAASAALDA